MLTVQRYWIRFGKQFGVGTLMLLLVSGSCSAASTAVVAGVVRDAQGVAQMGAMVQVLAAGSASVATAFTDLHGRYRIANLVPGSYQVRATAALFVPATRRDLRLSTGMLATVNLTLSMLSDPAAWLPAERRKADEPGDDWTWTLRSTANRPILRMLGNGQVISVASDQAQDSHHAPIAMRAWAMGGDQGFGTSGSHTVVALDRAGASGSDWMVRTDVAAGAQNAGTARAELDAGYQDTSGFAGSSRMVVSYASHPEMMSSGDRMGMQLTRISSARKMQLGDAVDVEAGGTVYAIHTTGTALTAQPFLLVSVHPGEVWAVRYKLATSRDLQGFDGLDSIATNLPVAAMSGGRLLTDSGKQQEVSLTRKVGGGVIEAAVFRNTIDHSALSGIGVMSSVDMAAGEASSEVLVDTATNRFRLLGAGYTTNGVSLTFSEPLASNFWATLEYERSAALLASNTSLEELTQVTSDLRPEAAGTVTAAVKGRVQRTGTKVRAAYRWQPQRLVTAVDPYGALADQAYLGFYVRQSVRWGDRLPPGIEATIDVTNLLAQGYQPFLSADGRTLFLAESPRTIQGGLSFTF